MIEYDVCSFNNSKVAYDHIKQNPDKYSLLIVDNKTPDGLFLATKLLDLNPKLNILLLNGSSKLGCNYKFNIIKKPISLYKLIRVVNGSISQSILHNNKF